jgi:hypothetical protein
MSLGVLTISAFLPCLAWATPSWVKDGSSLQGSTYTVTCSGDGPAMDTARKSAINGCQASAAQQLQHRISIKSVSVETESDVGFHQEVTESTSYSGLTCVPQNEEVEEKDAGFRVWLRCRFDLSKAKSENTDGAPADATSVVRSADRRVLSITTVPQCTTLLIQGAKARVQVCNHNPLAIVIQPGDQSIIIRATGYQPKTIPVSEKGDDYESVRVLLERN